MLQNDSRTWKLFNNPTNTSPRLHLLPWLPVWDQTSWDTFPYFNSTCKFAKKKNQQFTGETFHTEYSHCVQGVQTSYLQWSHCEAAHVVPEDQSAMRPCGGDDRGLEVRGVTIAPIWTVCIQIPTLPTASIKETAQDHYYVVSQTVNFRVCLIFRSMYCTDLI